MTHRLLERQLTKFNIHSDQPPTNREDWQKFLQHVERTYADADQDRYLLERSLTISSNELLEVNEQLRKKSEYSTQALQENIKLQEAIFNNAGYTIIVTDLNGLIRNFNLAAEQLLGYRSKEVVNQKSIISFFNPAELKTQAAQLSEKLGKTVLPNFELLKTQAIAAATEADWQFLTKKGDQIGVHISLSSLKNSQEEVIGFVAIVNDITERLEIEDKLTQQQEFMRQLTVDLQAVFLIGNTVASHSTEEAMFDSAVDLIKSHYDLYHVQGYLYHSIGNKLTLISASKEIGPEILAKYPIQYELDPKNTHPVVQTAWQEKTLTVANCETSPEFTPYPLLPDIRSQLTVPMMIGDEIYGVLELLSSTPNFFAVRDIRSFQMLGSYLAVLMQNTRNLTNAKNIVQDLSVLSRRLAREGWQEHLQDKDQELLGYQYDLTKIAPVEPDTLINTFYPRESNGTNGSITQPLSVLGETIGQLSIDEPDELGEDGAWVADAVASQLSAHLENLRLTEQTEQALKVTEILYDIGVALTSANGTREIMEVAVSEQIVPNLYVANLSYIDADTDTGKPRYMTIMSNWLSENASPNAVYPEGHIFDLNEFPMSRLWRENPNEPLFFENVQTDKRIDSAAQVVYRQVNMKGHVIVPLQAQNQIVGLIAYYWDQPRRFSAREEQIYRSLITQVGTVLQNQNLFSQTEEALAETAILYEVSARLNAANTLDELANALATPDLAPVLPAVTVMHLEEDDEGMPAYASVIASKSDETALQNAPEIEIGTRFELHAIPLSDLWIENPDTPLLISNVSEDDRFGETTSQLLEQVGSKAMAILPLKQQNNWIGLVTLTWSQPITFAEREQRMYQAIARQTTVALQNQTLFIQTQEALRETAALYQISAKLNVANSLEEVVQAMVNPREFTGWRASSLSRLIVDENNMPIQSVIQYVHTPLGAIDDLVGMEIELKNSPYRDIWIENPNEVLLVGDVLKDDRLDDKVRKIVSENNGRAMLNMPLKQQDQWLGLLNITWNQPQTFTEQDRRFFNALARQATITLSNHTLFAQTQERATQMATVSDVSTAASTILDPDQLLQTVVDLTKERFNLYHAHIYIIEGDELILRAGAGEVGREMVADGWHIPLFHKTSIVAKTAQTRAGIIENDVRSTKNFLQNPNLPHTRSELAVPLVAGENLLGVLDVQAESINAFTDQDVLIQTTLATQVAIALQNAELYREQLETAEKLREVDRLKTEFLARMSHELRTPLNSIIGFSDILLEGLDGPLTERMEEDVTVIRDSGRHLRELIGDILDLAKIEAGMMSLSYQEVELSAICDEAIATTLGLAMQKQLELSAIVPDDLPIVKIDRTRIKQVLINLIGNAIKFTHKGQVTLEVAPTAKGLLRFTVADTGIGISEEDMAMVFEEFRQVDGGLTRDSGGTGLGVPISRHLVELHNGTMGVESVLGEGSTFWFEIPQSPLVQEEKDQ